MRFTLRGLVIGLVVSAVLSAAALAGLRMFGYLGSGQPVDEAASLSKQANDALEAVRQRQPGDRRPASYDQVLAPLDRLLREANVLVTSDAYDPVTDFDKVRSITTTVMDIAARADAQARSETGFLTKEYRFNDQRGEASQYLATAMWERINARQPSHRGPLGEADPLPAGEMNELRRVLDAGIEVAPDNRDLYYIRGVVNRAEGLFAQSARDLERAIEIDANYAPAWNTLGLVRISLKEFDQAEDALERAKTLALNQARQLNTEPGAEYQAIVYNLASFHENLATFYARENRVNPTVETQRLLSKHTSDARKYLEEFVASEPQDSPDYRAAMSQLNTLRGGF